MADKLIGSQAHYTTCTPLPLPPISLHIGASNKVLGVELKLHSWQSVTLADGRIRASLVMKLVIFLRGSQPLSFTLKKTYNLGRAMDFKSISLGPTNWSLDGQTLVIRPETILHAFEECPDDIPTRPVSGGEAIEMTAFTAVSKVQGLMCSELLFLGKQPPLKV